MSAGKKIIDFNKITLGDKGMVKATMVRNIVQARVASKTERDKLPNRYYDVIVESLIEEPKLISRKELVDNYKYISGKKIRLISMRSGDNYHLIKEDKTKYYVYYIPKGCYGRINNRTLGNNKYIVFKPGEHGEIDRSSFGVIPRSVFRKMFIIDREDLQSARAGRPLKEAVSTIQKDKSTHQNKPNPLNIGRKTVREEAIQYKFKAIGKILGEGDAQVGFVLEDSKGNRRDVPNAAVANMCKQKKISNITLAKSEKGNWYLRGNGIKIGELPIKRLR